MGLGGLKKNAPERRTPPGGEKLPVLSEQACPAYIFASRRPTPPAELAVDIAAEAESLRCFALLNQPRNGSRRNASWMLSILMDDLAQTWGIHGI
jgi:hypothetical protein